MEVRGPVPSPAQPLGDSDTRSLNFRCALAIVRVAGLLQPRRRHEFMGELSAIGHDEPDACLGYAVGTLVGATVERADAIRRPLTMRNVSKAFGSHQVLRDINLAVQPGTITGLTGGNGGGKSTLIRLLAGHVEIDEGRILYGGVAIRGGPIEGVSVVRAEDLIDSFTVAENISFSGRSRWMNNRNREHIDAAWALNLLGADIDPGQRVSRLDALGRLQVRLAREIVAGTSGLLLLDEPSRNLSFEGVSTAFKNIAALRDLGFGVIVVSHQIEELLGIADRMAVLHDGRLVRDAPIDEISAEEIIGCITGGNATRS
jgi:ABC-type sugar transport system ATPase subunit